MHSYYKFPYFSKIIIILIIAISPLTFAKKLVFQGKIILSNKDIIQVKIAYTNSDRAQGLSGVKNNDFKYNDSMLFFFLKEGPRVFVMPDTYFDLDIFFLDKNLKVLDIERGMKHHLTRKTPPPIDQTRAISCRHVLEMRADSPLAQKIKINTKLSWVSRWSLEQIESKIRSAK